MGLKHKQSYYGFEQGPIRPPSEASSLLLRITRNCPWNRCTFCSIYKGQKFTLRPVDHVIADIDAIYSATVLISDALEKSVNEGGGLNSSDLSRLAAQFDAASVDVFYTAANWLSHGDGSVFLQDANSLIIKPDDLISILTHLKDRFPWISRVTSYARSYTINKISDDKLSQIAASGLNRIHIGMESASDVVLERINKGVSKAHHISAGKKVKQAGIELSEYVMPGMGGTDFSIQHAAETADALNQIDPDFIRLRTLAIPTNIPLYEEYQSGDFKKCTDLQVVAEIRRMIEALDGISSVLKSDHILNLLQELEGVFPEDKQKMLAILDEFLALPEQDQVIYQVGRRMGIFQTLSDLHSLASRQHVEGICQRMAITANNVDSIIEQQMRQFI